MKSVSQLFYRTFSCRSGTGIAAEYFSPQRLLMLVLLAGVALGAALPVHLPETLRTVLGQGMAVSDSLRTLWDVCRDAVCPVLVMLWLMLLCGTSALGQPLTLLLLLLRGMGLGTAAAECFLSYPLQTAFCACAGMVLPFGFLSALILTQGAMASLRLSHSTAGYLLRAKPDPAVADVLRGVLRRMLLLLPLTIAAGALHTWLVWLLSDRLLIQ